jgi:nucleoside-diphosphate-sugar epimerase
VNALVTGGAGFVGTFAWHILLGQSCIVYGDGEQKRDLSFVDDVTQANMLAMQGSLDTFSIGPGVETTLNQLLAAFEHVFGHPVAQQHEPARGSEVQRIALDASEAGHKLGWRRAVSLDDGLAQALTWVGDRSLGWDCPTGCSCDLCAVVLFVSRLVGSGGTFSAPLETLDVLQRTSGDTRGRLQ